MNKFHAGKIYAIRSITTDNVYIGSTCSPLNRRLSAHRKCYDSFLNGECCFISSFDVIMHGSYFIELVEEIKCENRKELNIREGYFIRTTPNCVNKNIAGRTYKQWKADNIEMVKERDRLYRLVNRERIVKKCDCICGGKYTMQNKARHLQTLMHRKYITTVVNTPLLN